MPWLSATQQSWHVDWNHLKHHFWRILKYFEDWLKRTFRILWMFKDHHEMWNLIAKRRKEILFFIFNVIKLVLFWHKHYYWVHFFIFWKSLLSKIISGFLFMVTVNGCILLFFYHNQTHRTTNAQSKKPQNRHFTYVYFCFLWNVF